MLVPLLTINICEQVETAAKNIVSTSDDQHSEIHLYNYCLIALCLGIDRAYCCVTLLLFGLQFVFRYPYLLDVQNNCIALKTYC